MCVSFSRLGVAIRNVFKPSHWPAEPRGHMLHKRLPTDLSSVSYHAPPRRSRYVLNAFPRQIIQTYLLYACAVCVSARVHLHTPHVVSPMLRPARRGRDVTPHLEQRRRFTCAANICSRYHGAHQVQRLRRGVNDRIQRFHFRPHSILHRANDRRRSRILPNASFVRTRVRKVRMPFLNADHHTPPIRRATDPNQTLFLQHAHRGHIQSSTKLCASVIGSRSPLYRTSSV